MNWDAIAAIAESIGAVGVIASLLYLAIQVRGSIRASEIESKLAASGLYGDFLGALVQSPELNEIYLRGREDLGSLERPEFFRFSNLALQAFSLFSAVHFQYSRNALSESDWYEYQAIIRFWLRGAGCRDWWRTVGRHVYGPHFVAFIDSEHPSKHAALQDTSADKEHVPNQRSPESEA